MPSHRRLDAVQRGIAELDRLAAHQADPDAIEQVRRYADDPVNFARRVLELTLWDKQVRLLEVLTTTLLRACHE